MTSRCTVNLKKNQVFIESLDYWLQNFKIGVILLTCL